MKEINNESQNDAVINQILDKQEEVLAYVQLLQLYHQTKFAIYNETKYSKELIIPYTYQQLKSVRGYKFV